MKAIIMAGGEGSRLRPLTCTAPKPMMRLLDKPVLEYAIALLKKHGITDIAVTLKYMPREITDYFEDGSAWGVHLTYFYEQTFLGTAGSVKNTKDFANGTFLVLSGDAICDVDLQDAVTFHRKNGAAATLVIRKKEVPLDYGVVLTDETGRVRRLIEKPDWSQVTSDTVNTGIYILEPSVLEPVPADTFCDFSESVFPTLLRSGARIYGYETKGYWCDIGDVFAYMTCQYDMLSGRVRLPIGGREYAPGIRLGENVVVHPEVTLRAPLYIGNNTVIDRGANILEHSVIGSNVYIGPQSSVKRSIVLGDSHIGRDVQLRGCIIGRGSVLKNRACVYEQAVVGDGCILGADSDVHPSIKLWPGKEVGEGISVRSNLVWEHGRKRMPFHSGVLEGEIHTDLSVLALCRAGAAFGTAVGGRVAVSVSGTAAAHMLVNALMSGLMSVGCEPYACGMQILPLTRRAIGFYKLNGGVHIHAAEDKEGQRVTVRFMDRDGCDIDAKLQRQLERLYEKEEYKLCRPSRVKGIVQAENFKDLWLNEAAAHLRLPAGHGYKVYIHAPTEAMECYIQQIASRLGFQAVFATEAVSCYDAASLAAFAARVKSGGYDLGAVMSEMGDSAVFADESGTVVERDVFHMLACRIVLEAGCDLLAVPADAPAAIEAMAQAEGIGILFSKTDANSYMRAILKCGNTLQFTFAFDGLGSMLELLRYLANNGLTLREATAGIQKSCVKRMEVPCANARKGAVLRQLIQSSALEDMDMTDGVKFYRENGWVLVLPDALRPKMHIVSEGVDMEAAAELCAELLDKIKGLTTDA